MISIVIVSMNKPDYLKKCLNSIYTNTTVKIDIYVVAYIYSKENLSIIKDLFPKVIIIESNEIRGFSENNNLALKLVNTEYTFVLNDDTIFEVDVLGFLKDSLLKTPNATVISPILRRPDGSIQFSGRRKYTFIGFIFEHFGFRDVFPSKYENKEGVFQTYNISGAAFLIKTEVFKKVGLFDEKYFFCPEDIVLSTTLNKLGYKCYVDSKVDVIHYEGVSSKKTKLFYATTSVAYLGSMYFFCNSFVKRLILLSFFYIKLLALMFINNIHSTDHSKDYIYIYKIAIKSFLENKPTKQHFIDEYNKI